MHRPTWSATGAGRAGAGIGWALAGSALCHLAAVYFLILRAGGVAGGAGSAPVMLDLVPRAEEREAEGAPSRGASPSGPNAAGWASGTVGEAASLSRRRPPAGDPAASAPLSTPLHAAASASPAPAAAGEPPGPAAQQKVLVTPPAPAREGRPGAEPGTASPHSSAAAREPAGAFTPAQGEGGGREGGIPAGGSEATGGAATETAAGGSGEPVGPAGASPDDGRRGTPALLRERIRSRIVYPEEAIRRGQQGEVVLRIRIGTGGIPGEIKVARSSGVPLLDEAARRGVVRAAPLPSEPGWVDVPVRFVLR